MRRALRSSKVKVGPSVGVIVFVGIRGLGVNVDVGGSVKVGDMVRVGSKTDTVISAVGILAADPGSDGVMGDGVLEHPTTDMIHINHTRLNAFCA